MRVILLSMLALAAATVHAQIAVKGDTVYTVTGEAIANGVVLIRDGKIEAVGPADKVAVPGGYKLYTGKVVTPGLVDAHATVGFTGIYNQRHDQDQLEKSKPIQPELRAIDAYNPLEELVAFLRGLGVTTVHTGHGPGALVSGQTMVAKTAGTTVEEALVDDAVMLAFTLGSDVGDNYKSPGTRSKGIALLRAELLKAQAYKKKMTDKDETKRPARDLSMEALVRLLDGELKALITAHRTTEIMSAIRLAREFGFRLVLDGASEAYMLVDEIKASGAEVILHPVMMRARGETRNASMETAALLTKAGIAVALQSGYEGYVPKTRVVLYEAAAAMSNGLPFGDALRAVTINAARIIGADKRVGSIEAGKDADIVIYDGDPFEYTTHVCVVIINGRVTDENCRRPAAD